VKGYRILSNAASDADIEAAFEWYESEQPGLGLEFLNEIRATHLRILDEPLKYAVLRSGIRRAITRRFPYGITSQSRMTSFSLSRSSTLLAIPQNGSSASNQIMQTANPVALTSV